MNNKELRNDLTLKLKYLGLDLKNIPECLQSFHPLEFNVSRLNNDKDHKVFRFVPIDKIEILLTPHLRSDSVREKYSDSMPLNRYLAGDRSEEGIELYTTFLKMLNDFSITDVENVSNIQKEMKDKVPFRVKYNKEHLWHLYYSPSVDRYFMMVCTKESTFAEFFYLLKKKIEIAKHPGKESPTIFVPINYLNYSEMFLNRDEIVDCENYLWLFTKNWPVVYEVCDKKGKISLQIIGETFVFEDVTSTYKIVLQNSEDAIKFYKVLKALFIMQTEIKNKFHFLTKINSKNELELYFENKKITYENLASFIKEQYDFAKIEIEKKNKDIISLEKELKEYETQSHEMETEYIKKQREIGAFLECRKTFMGKMKYFFKSNKISKKIKKEVEKERFNLNINNEDVSNSINMKPIEAYMADKINCTIEDLVVIYGMFEEANKKEQNLLQDKKAMELKIENLKRKLKNAETYIAEIDKHKRSIFEFWKFTSKDEILSLDSGNPEEEKVENNIQKVFDFESDFEVLGAEMDELQRRKLSKEETDSIFVTNSKIINVLNDLKKGNMNEMLIKETFFMLKEEFNKNRLTINEESFDIFGNITEDTRKLRYIGSRSHRENEKSEYKILNINKNIDEFDFTEKLQLILNYIDGALPKIHSKYNLSLYKLVEIPNVLDENALIVADLNAQNELSSFEDIGDGALNLLKINIKEDMPLLFFTNIIYYDNTNKTLPEGMNISSKVLIDTSKFNLKLISQNKFRTNNYFRESKNLILPKSKDIFVYEYDVEIKK